MIDPNELFQLPPDSDDETIRRRYLELVKQYPPEHHPEKFARVREAYESMRDLTTRAQTIVFDTGKNESIDAIIQELPCLPTQRRRISMAKLYKQVMQGT